MKILNLYCTCSGNTHKVARQIEKTAKSNDHKVETIAVTNDLDENSFNFLDYDFVFIGSGVYSWLPPRQMQSFIERVNKKHMTKGDIKMCSPRINNKKVVSYCTFGGPHTGINEALIVPKYLAQLFDHLGFEVAAEWHFEGQFNAEGFTQFSKGGRIGDITGRPDEKDLERVNHLVDGILQL